MKLNKLLKHCDQIFERDSDILLVSRKISYFSGVDFLYREVLDIGGIHAYSRALRVFGLTNCSEAKNIIWWNEPETWKAEYKGFFDNIWAFAEDIFGNQFVFYKNGIGWLEVETGAIRPICKTFSEWIGILLKDVNYYTGSSLAESWQKSHHTEPLNGMYHLCPIKPFVCGGKYDINNVFRCDAKENLSLKAEIAQQIHKLPEGTEIRINLGS
jgi:hypothetical protein